MTSHFPTLHGARGLAAHEILERHLRDRERAKALQAGLDSLAENLRDAAQRFMQAVDSAVRAAKAWMAKQLAWRIFDQATTPRWVSRRFYWQNQAARLERLNARSGMLPRQARRLSLARCNI